MSSSPTIAVVDYGFGNLRSVAKALERCALEVEVSGDPAAIARADAVVLPGVGAFKDAAESLAGKGLDRALVRAIESGKPYLGLCLGLQLLFEEGHEHGVTPGFGILRGRVERFPERDTDGSPLCVPHIGWNEVTFSGSHPMLAALPEREHYYFVHSYRAVPADASDVVGRTEYGGSFASAVAREGIFAVQFHPEKSQSAGHRVLEAFAAWVRR
jgi:glutamine amidotransferase